MARTCMVSRFRRAGLTLIELVIVMAILATLAALVIPKLGFLQAEATPVSGMASSQDLMNNLETYKVTTGFYPLRFDSLLTQAGAVIPQIFAMGSGTNPTFVPAAFDTDPYAAGSWGMAFGPSSGTYTIMDQDATINDVNASFNTPRVFSYGGDNVVTVSTATNAGAAIWQAAGFQSQTAFNYNFSNGVATGAYTAPTTATGVQLVAVGVGPQCSAVGKTMSSPPLQTGQQAGFYARYIAVFAVYGTNAVGTGGQSIAGKQAELKLILDSFGNTVQGNFELYQQVVPQDS